VRLVAAPHSIFKLAIMLRQSSSDDVRALRQISIKGRFEKNGLADLKFVGWHVVVSKLELVEKEPTALIVDRLPDRINRFFSCRVAARQSFNKFKSERHAKLRTFVGG